MRDVRLTRAGTPSSADDLTRNGAHTSCVLPNEIDFSGERKRIRRNEGLGATDAPRRVLTFRIGWGGHASAAVPSQ